MEKPLVSVIIPNYNYAKYIRNTIDSVLGQTYDRLEVIVVDDESNDNSLTVLKDFGDEITLLEQKNQGVSHARNNGVGHSSGEFLAFLDADDIWLPSKIERQIEKFNADSELGMVHCSMTYIDTDDKVCGENRDGMEGFVAHELLRFEKGVVIGVGSTSLIRKTIFEELGGFDFRMSTAADWDFSFRLASKYKIGFVRDPLVLYRMHNSNMHSNIRVMEHDMMLGFEKAFSGLTTENRRKCYGNLHRTLAGSYFYSGKYADFARNAAKSILYKPSNLSYFLKFPVRRLRKK